MRATDTMNSMVLLFCLLVPHEGHVNSRAVDPCPVSREKADKCAMDVLFFGMRTNVTLESVGDMAPYCLAQKENIRCLERHSLCMKGFSREMLKISTRFMKGMVKRVCNTREERQVFYHHSKCFDSVRKRMIYQCVDKLLVMLKNIRDQISLDDHFEALCCTFTIYKGCFMSATKKVCDDVTGPETSKYIDLMVKQSLDQLVDMPCGRLSTQSECEERSPNITSLVSWTFLRKDIRPQNESIVFPIIDIVSRHSEDAN